MGLMKIWNTINILLVLAISIFGQPTCITRFQSFRAEVLCRGGEGHYILKKGLVSDNNKTIAITLTNCHITEVEIEAFKNNYKLEDINLSHNNVTYLKLGVLDGIPKLTSLRLSKNLLTSIPLGLFDQLPQLRILDISDNKINYFQLSVFDKLTNLKFLELSGNEFLGKDLDPFIFNKNPRITHLHLSGNNMLGAPEQFLNSIRSLFILRLNNCSLTEIPKFATRSNLKTMKQLFLQINKIKSLDDPETFANLENLVALDLMGNIIEYLNESVFKPLSKLRSIDLSFNNIVQVPENLFQGMLSVQNIDLANNLIEIIPVNVFGRVHLQTLDLRGNRIAYLDRNFIFELANFNKRLTFYFNNNPFQCACLLDILNEAKRFGVKYDTGKYNGVEAVCLMTGEFTCMRHKFEFEYSIDVR